MILPSTLKIIDYTFQNLFEKALTSSAILVCDKGVVSQKIQYHDVVNNTNHMVEKSFLIDKWIFIDNSGQKKSKKRFGDYFTVAISIATLLNKVYILKNFTEESDYIITENFRIERALLRKGVSPRSLNFKNHEVIIFPYMYDKNALIRYTTEDFEKKFPEATRYLKSYSQELSERNSDNSSKWFEYGRSQALAHLNQPKLLLSTVVTKKVKVYELSRECIPYSGIYIIPKKDLPLTYAKEILESKSFFAYVNGIGINASGSSLRITSIDINNYEF